MAINRVFEPSSSGEENVSNQHWLTQTERWLLVGAGVGTAATLAGQNLALASAPLTVLAAVGLLNRNRMEKALSESQLRLYQQQQQQNQQCQDLHKQVTALPAPEALNHFQRAVMKRNNRNFMRLSQEIKEIRSEVHEGLKAIPNPDLSALNQDISQLQDQYAYTAATVDNLTSYVQRVATTPRMEAAEAKLSQVKGELTHIQVHVECLQAETRNTVGGLQDTIAALDNQLRRLSYLGRPESIKTELSEVVRAITNLVTQTEFSNLVEHVKDLAQRQTSLEQELVKFSNSAAPHSGDTKEPGPPPRSFADATLRVDLDHLNTAVRRLQRQVSRHETASDTRGEMQSTVSLYLGQLKAQLSQLEGVTQSLVERQNQLAHQLDRGMAASAETLTNRKAIIKLAHQLRHTQTTVRQLQQREHNGADAGTVTSATEWMVDIPVTPKANGESYKLSGQAALEQAIDQTQRRLLLIWPWSRAVTIDEDLLKRFTRLLERGCDLEIGWCHRGDQVGGRLIWRISQRWSTESSQLTQLKSALNALLPLREHYPEQFRFKIIGTAENFLVCDNSTAAAPNNSFAILGVQSLATQSVTFPEVEVKLRSADPHVVQGLIQRFRDPVIAPGDTTAFFNRGTTRHDLRDQPGAIQDYERVLSLQPDNAVVLNNRGAAQMELNNPDAAEIDFTEALNHNPRLFAAYCNRGWLRLEQHRYPAAVEDFTQAITLNPHLPMAYVYRGSALQKLGDLKGAVRDYSDAIACGEPLGLPYCYRSAAYQSQGDRERAISDLQLASAHLKAQGDHHTLSSVQRQLTRLQHLTSPSSSAK
jgi:tetratricopeptide (TPR) repeat protein